jgi:hypothetical protein
VTGRLLAIGLALIVLLGGAYAYWTLRNDRAIHDTKDASLRIQLTQMRGAIRKFREDKGRPPHSLEELTPDYLRRIPVDPVTGRADWKVDTEEVIAPRSDFSATTTPAPQSYVIDVHSAAGPPWSGY